VFAEKYLERCSETTSINQVEVLRLFRRTHSRHRRPDQPGAASDYLLAEALLYWHQSPGAFPATPAPAPVAAPVAAGAGTRESDGGDGRTGAVSTAPASATRIVRTPPPPSPSGFYKGIRLKNTFTGF